VTALATSLPLESGRTWLGWILPGSVALHVLAIMVLPSASRAPGAPAPLVIEMADPPEPPPPPPPEEPAPEPAPVAAPPVARSAPAPARAPASRQSQAATDRPAEDSPVDFSSAVMSNDGPGMTIGSGGGGAGPSHGAGGAVSAAGARSAPPAEPRVVAVKDLSRRPGAPGLDAALEKHYPLEARRSGISGKAVLRVRILPNGRVGKVQQVEETRSGFADACEKAVRSAAWEPPLDREGAPVATEITYTCRFEIRG